MLVCFRNEETLILCFLYFLKMKTLFIHSPHLSHSFLGHFSLREKVVGGSLERSMSLNPYFLTNSFGMQNSLFPDLLKKLLELMFFGLMPRVNLCVAQRGCV